MRKEWIYTRTKWLAAACSKLKVRVTLFLIGTQQIEGPPSLLLVSLYMPLAIQRWKSISLFLRPPRLPPRLPHKPQRSSSIRCLLYLAHESPKFSSIMNLPNERKNYVYTTRKLQEFTLSKNIKQILVLVPKIFHLFPTFKMIPMRYIPITYSRNDRWVLDKWILIDKIIYKILKPLVGYVLEARWLKWMFWKF